MTGLMNGGMTGMGRGIVKCSLGAGLLAGLLAWILGLLALNAFRPRLFPVQRPGYIAMVSTQDSETAAEAKNVACAWAILGGSVSMAMGVAGAIEARDPKRGIFVGLMTQAVGSLIGALIGLTLVPIWKESSALANDALFRQFVMHASIFVWCGLIGGIAFSLGRPTRAGLWPTIGGAILGAMIAAVIHELIAVLLPPTSGVSQPISAWASVRLVTCLLASLGVGLGAALGNSYQEQSTKVGTILGDATGSR